MKIFLTSLLLLFALQFTFAQTNLVSYKKNISVEAEQWQVNDIVFNAKVLPSENPFDTEFGAIYSGPNGERLNVPGFFDGNGTWISRFSSKTLGKWNFETYSSKVEMSGLKGSIEITPNTRADQRGAVTIDPANPQAFIYEDGTPHFMLAFEADWLFALDYKNLDAIPRTEQMLSDIQQNGFNHVVMNVYAYDVGWKVADNVPSEYFFGRPDYSPFLGTNENPDFSQLNLKLFQHLDRVFAAMQAKGIDVHLMIYVWNKKVNWPEMYSKADNLYFDYIIDRFQAFSNVIWDVSKEALDYNRVNTPYINERISRIRQKDAFKRLLTVHDYEYNSREAHRVDFISIQSWRSNLYSLMLDGRKIHSDKPIVNIEHGGYEKGPYLSFLGNYTSPETCLERTYECIFAGVYGSYYWQDGSWNIVIWDAMNPKHPITKPRYDYYKHLAGLFERYDYNSLKPSFSKITTNSRLGENNLATNGYALFDGNGLYLMFVPKESDRLNAVLPKPESGKMKVTWFNPLTGEYHEKGVVDWNSWYDFVSPWQYSMSVVIIEMV